MPALVPTAATSADASAPTCPRCVDAERGFTTSWTTAKRPVGDVSLKITITYPGTDAQVVEVPIRLR